MATVDDVQKDGFSFIWTIHNFSYCVGTSLLSPAFMTNEKSNDEWRLILYPKGIDGSDSIRISIKNLLEVFLPTEISFELSICTSLGILNQVLNQKKRFKSFEEHRFNCNIRQKDLNKKESSANIINDSVTVLCKIWEVNNKPVPSGQCNVRTIIDVERLAYVWNIHNFQEGFNNNKISKKRPPVLSEKSFFTMELTSTGGAFSDDNIQIEIKPIKSVNECFFSTCQMSLLNIDEKIVHSVRDEHWFEISKNRQVWKILFISKNKILSRKELYLPNGTLSLRCEFAVSSGVTYHEMETTENKTANLTKFENCNPEKDVDTLGSLKDNLKYFYTEKKLSDLIIRTSNKDYPVHKTILCARSEVFSAMFERDMKENLTGVVRIEDVDDDTVSKMLLFMYTDTLEEDLEFGTASSLYFAADKYGIVALKRKCSDFLKGNFTVTNVCDVLVLADMHQDHELKTAVHNFVFENSGEIMNSEKWTRLMQNNLQLASQTMRLFFRNSKA